MACQTHEVKEKPRGNKCSGDFSVQVLPPQAFSAQCMISCKELRHWAGSVGTFSCCSREGCGSWHLVGRSRGSCSASFSVQDRPHPHCQQCCGREPCSDYTPSLLLPSFLNLFFPPSSRINNRFQRGLLGALVQSQI